MTAKSFRNIRSAPYLRHLDTENYLAAVKTIDHLLTTFTIRQLYDKIRPIVERERDFNVAKKCTKYLCLKLPIPTAEFPVSPIKHEHPAIPHSFQPA